ncbi:MAG: hypothetical protein JOY74_05455 [Sinobacteraceae bacterium]|nr:hypothetical protein [Nevskiaceae bacterium]
MRSGVTAAATACLSCAALITGASSQTPVGGADFVRLRPDQIRWQAGSYMLHPAQALHWDGSNSNDEVIVQLVGIGPADTVQADPRQPFWVQLPP